MVLADSVALQEPHQPGGGGCSSSPTRHSPACDRSWLPTAGVADPVATPPGAGRDHLEAAHRPAVADVPERFGPWQTCYGRLRRWQRDGTWPRIWAVLAASEHDSGHDRRDQAAAPVAVAGAGLMTATPPRPPQHLADRGRRPPHQPDQQPPRLRGRDPHQVRPWRPWRLGQFCALSRPPRPLAGRWPPGRGPPPGTPERPAPG
jgi:hypothetical protein